MRKHTWGIILSQKEIPDFVRNAFSDLQQPRKWINDTYELQYVTYDPITDAQFALLTLTQLSEHGICSLSCSSEEVQEQHHQVLSVDASSGKEYLYTFTLRGHFAVSEEHGEDIAYGWIKTALEELALDLPENLQKQVKDFKMSSVDLSLENDGNKNWEAIKVLVNTDLEGEKDDDEANEA